MTTLNSDTRAIPGLSDLASAVGGRATALRVCIVTSEVIGPTRNGGIGTATSGLIDHLVGDGHRVTVLYTQVWNNEPLCTESSWSHWVDEFGRRKVELLHIQHGGDYAEWRLKSWLVMTHLRDRDYDVVYLNEHHGSGYFALAAKRAGLMPFANQVYCVITHGSIEWVYNTNKQYMVRSSDLEIIGLERRSVEWADVVIGPSEYLLHEYRGYGWQLPPNTYCQPYALFRKPAEYDEELRQINEVVFFGRLEARKGLWLFCDVLDRLSDQLRGKTVTFMGRMTDVSGASSGALIVNRSSDWPFQVRLLTRMGPHEAIKYLASPGKLAVMPSLADNSPCVVYECMENGIPFVTTRGSGADELVHPDTWPDVMVGPEVEELTERLAKILEAGARLGRPRFDPLKNLETWSKWHSWLSVNKARFRSTIQEGTSKVPESDRQVALFVTIDTGIDTLQTVVGNVHRHSERLGSAVGHLVITSRREPLTGLLANLVNQRTADNAKIIVLNQAELQEARDVILASDVVFFAGAELDVLPSFFATALGLLKSGKGAAISCIVANREAGSEDLIISELPCGDIPGVGALQFPINSGVWAADVAALKDELSALEFDYPEYGALVSAEVLGHIAITKCRVAEKSYLLIPEVGGVVARGPDIGHRRSHWYTNASRIAGALGISQTVHPHVAPWYAMNVFGRERETLTEAPVPFVLALPDDHPLKNLSHSGDERSDATNLAAAFGRPSLAVQLGMMKIGQPERVGELLDLAKSALSSRADLNLLEAIAAALGAQHSDASRPTAAPLQSIVDGALLRSRKPGHSVRGEAKHVDPESESVAATLQNGSKLLDMVYVRPNGVTVEINSKAVLLKSVNQGASALMLMDVPVAGHTRLAARTEALVEDECRVTLTIFDQEVGDVIGTASARLGSRDVHKLEIDLHGIHCLSCIALQIDGRPNATIRLESFVLK